MSYNVTEARTRSRETNSLIRALKFFDLEEGVIITENEEMEETVDGFRIKYVPIWKFLIDL